MNAPRLSIIPARAATDPMLKPRDLQVLCVLGRHTNELGWCRRSQVRMAREMQCARSTVGAAIDRLVKRGYLEKHEQETENGRDSAHLYRVVLDPVHDNLDSVQEDETVEPDHETGCETSSKLACRYIGTPADISAPPAGPESAPPAGPESAPMLTTPLNDPSLTEREGTREDEGKSGQTASRETWKRRFKKTHADWPTYVGDSDATAEREWFALTEEDRDKAATLSAAYVGEVRRSGRTKFCAFAVYLRERRWEKLPEHAVAALNGATGTVAKPFGKAWGARRFADLMRSPYGHFPPLTSFLKTLIAKGGPEADRERLARQAKYGWPDVNVLHAQALSRKGTTSDPALEPLEPLFEAVAKGSPLWIAWKAEHAARGWPWFGSDSGCADFVYMPAPPGGAEGHGEPRAAVRAALARFETEHATITRKDAAE